MAVLYLLGMIPDKYLILAAAILFFLWCVTLNSQVAKEKTGDFGKSVQFTYGCCDVYEVIMSLRLII